MSIVKTTEKGQVVIPIEIRKKYRIAKGTRITIYEKNGEIILKPLFKEPVKEGRGFFKDGLSALDVLIKDRQEEAKN